jgi:hypothetical protein
MIAGALREPALDQGRLVGRVVADDEMDVQLPGDRRVDRIQKFPKFDRAKPVMALVSGPRGADQSALVVPIRLIAAAVTLPIVAAGVRRARQLGQRRVKGYRATSQQKQHHERNKRLDGIHPDLLG